MRNICAHVISLDLHGVAATIFFPNLKKNLDPPFDFILPGSVWIVELCFSLCYILDCLNLN